MEHQRPTVHRHCFFSFRSKFCLPQRPDQYAEYHGQRAFHAPQPDSRTTSSHVCGRIFPLQCSVQRPVLTRPFLSPSGVCRRELERQQQQRRIVACTSPGSKHWLTEQRSNHPRPGCIYFTATLWSLPSGPNFLQLSISLTVCCVSKSILSGSVTERSASAARFIMWPWQRTRWWTGSYSLSSSEVIRPKEVNTTQSY
jgi:hypothetical protein